MPGTSVKNNVRQLNRSQEIGEHRNSNNTRKWAKDKSKQLPEGE